MGAIFTCEIETSRRLKFIGIVLHGGSCKAAVFLLIARPARITIAIGLNETIYNSVKIVPGIKRNINQKKNSDPNN